MIESSFPVPLGGPPPAELPLSKAPLERVVAQIRFPVILKIEDKSVVSKFQEATCADYPILRELSNQSVRIEMGLNNAPTVVPVISRIWQFSDAPGAWKISLAADALTIETTSYHSRDDLLLRWSTVLNAMEGVFHPSLIERIGVRYVDRIVGGDFARFDSFMATRLMGTAFSELKSRLKSSLHEAVFDVEEGNLLLRWGVMPPGMTPDPGAIAPTGSNSFVLDIDVWSATQRAYSTNALGASFRQLMERAYSVFRFAVTDEFLQAYGKNS